MKGAVVADRIREAQNTVRMVLDEERAQVHGVDGRASWSGTFCLAEALCERAVNLIADCLGLGFAATRDGLSELRALEFAGEELFDFVETTSFERVELEARSTSSFGGLQVCDKLVTKVTEHWWMRRGEVRLFGVESSHRRVLETVSWEMRVSGTSNTVAPAPNRSLEALSCSSRILQATSFRINRELDSCLTPRRNQQVESWCHDLSALKDWCVALRCQLPERNGRVDPTAIPLVPALHLTPASWTELRRDHARQLQEKLSQQPDAVDKLVYRLMHVEEIVALHRDGVDHLERVLFTSLTDVLGREIDSHDFAEFAKSYMQKRMSEECIPRPFSYALRRSSEFDPEALVEIERKDVNALWETVRRPPSQKAITFSTDSSTVVKALPRVFLHGHMRHKFASESEGHHSLFVRARPFGCLIVLAGTMGQGNEFLPEHGIILENGTSLEIPLSCEEIPTQMQFREATLSLSVAQRQFLEQYRAMQISKSALALCFLHVKPQMERVLRLPLDCLTKELVLSLRLMELFLQYHIPRDLLAAPVSVDPLEAIHHVRRNVLEIESLLADLRKADALVPLVPARPPSPPLLEFPPYLVYLRDGIHVEPMLSESSQNQSISKPSRKLFTFRRGELPATPQTKAIDVALQAERKRRARKVQITLFGNPGAGKTTLLKALQLLHANGFSPAEKDEFTRIARFNCSPPIDEYFERESARILAEDGYELTDMDALQCHGTTQSVCSLEFMREGVHFEVIEVPQHFFRKNCSAFDNVAGVVFLADISSEESILESLGFFEDACNSPWFEHSQFLLFLNKVDLFRERVSKGQIVLENLFPDYDGGDATWFLREVFLGKRIRDRLVYVHYSRCTDIEHIRIVFNAVTETLLTKSLCAGGLGFDFGSSFAPPTRRENVVARTTTSKGSASRHPTGGVQSHHVVKLAKEKMEPVSIEAARDASLVSDRMEPPRLVMGNLESIGGLAKELNDALDIPGLCITQTRLLLKEDWILESRPGLIGSLKRQLVEHAERKRSRDLAFDLIDQLTVSGALDFEECELHIMFACSQQYDMSVMETLVQSNVDLVESLERGMRAFASVILGVSQDQVLRPEPVMTGSMDAAEFDVMDL